MIIGLILSLIIVILLIYLYINDITDYLILYLLSFFMMQLILFKVGFTFAPTINNVLYFVIVILFISYIINRRLIVNTNIVKLFIYIFTVIFYIITLDVIRGINPLDHVMLVIHYFWGLILFVLILYSNKYKNIEIIKFDKFILLIVLLYSILGILQYVNLNISSYFVVLEYDWRGETQRTFQDVFVGTNVLTGTMLRMANFGNIMALLINYLLAKFLMGRISVSNILFYSIIIFASSVIILSGIRTSLGTFLIGVALNIWFFKRNKLILFSIILIPLLIYIVPILIMIGTESINQGVQTENSIHRAFGLFYIFSSDADLTDVTLFRSINMIEIVKQNPIFGVGTYYQSGYKGIDSVTDAFLLFHIAEIGLIGLTLLLYPYIYIIKKIRRINRKSYYMTINLFVILLLQTITDNGIFYLVANMLFWILVTVNYKSFNN